MRWAERHPVVAWIAAAIVVVGVLLALNVKFDDPVPSDAGRPGVGEPPSGSYPEGGPNWP
jgi:hypothetical protein